MDPSYAHVTHGYYKQLQHWRGGSVLRNFVRVRVLSHSSGLERSSLQSEHTNHSFKSFQSVEVIVASEQQCTTICAEFRVFLMIEFMKPLSKRTEQPAALVTSSYRRVRIQTFMREEAGSVQYKFGQEALRCEI